MSATPYRTTPVFDQDTMPDAMRHHHSTRAGVWGLFRVLSGSVRIAYENPASKVTVKAGSTGLLKPQQLHSITPLGDFTARVEFYDEMPAS